MLAIKKNAGIRGFKVLVWINCSLIHFTARLQGNLMLVFHILFFLNQFFYIYHPLHICNFCKTLLKHCFATLANLCFIETAKTDSTSVRKANCHSWMGWCGALCSESKTLTCCHWRWWRDATTLCPHCCGSLRWAGQQAVAHTHHLLWGYDSWRYGVSSLVYCCVCVWVKLQWYLWGGNGSWQQFVG